MTGPAVMVEAVGREGEPLVVVDGFSGDPDALRAAAVASRFGPAGHHYPGLRAPVQDGWWMGAQPILTAAIHDAFGMAGTVRLIDASFSIVTTPPTALTLKQRLPHCDAFGRGRVALVHYLSPEGGDGTAFFRHRATGFETVDEGRAPAYFGKLEAELREGGPPPRRYVAEDTPLFERVALAEARYDRALLYRSCLLHSGAIRPDAALSPDPAKGRLTITAFMTVE